MENYQSRIDGQERIVTCTTICGASVQFTGVTEETARQEVTMWVADWRQAKDEYMRLATESDPLPYANFGKNSLEMWNGKGGFLSATKIS